MVSDWCHSFCTLFVCTNLFSDTSQNFWMYFQNKQTTVTIVFRTFFFCLKYDQLIEVCLHFFWSVSIYNLKETHQQCRIENCVSGNYNFFSNWTGFDTGTHTFTTWQDLTKEKEKGTWKFFPNKGNKNSHIWSRF